GHSTPSGTGSHEETLKHIPSSRLLRDLPGDAQTSETPVAFNLAFTRPSALQVQTNPAIPRSLRETMSRKYGSESNPAAIFGNHIRVPKVSDDQVTF
ncbi:MAG: hypothetical protein ACRD3K_05530, partial [Edaphobacter sp.]